MTAETVTVEVRLGDRAYDILIGPGALLARAGAEIASRLPGVRTAIVTDRNVAAAHLDNLTAGLAAGGIESVPIVLAPGEKTKSFDALQEVVDGMLSARLERGDAVVAFGGGVIGDLAGFAAGIVRRGMGFVQIPTTAPRAGRFIRWWQDRHQQCARQEPCRRLPSAALVVADTECLIRLPARISRRLRRSRQIRADRPAGFLLVAGEELARHFRRWCGACRGDRPFLPRQGRRCRPRRMRDRRPRTP